MERIYFSRGLKGAIARGIQGNLLAAGFFAGSQDKFVDGDFAGHTESALLSYQVEHGLTAHGGVDEATWGSLSPGVELPRLFERCLGVTAAFEGHGFGLVKGNFDGAGLTWGIIGFTLSHREIQQITKAAEAAHPGILDQHFQGLREQWLKVCTMEKPQAVAWADSISTGPHKEGLRAEWLTAFARLGDDARVQQIQRQRAFGAYFEPAIVSARQLGLTTELGLALAFDVHVQNGGFKPDAFQAARAVAAGAPQAQRRAALAEAVAAGAAAQWRADVRSRKETFALGTGEVHGAKYRLNAWGLDDSPAAELAPHS